MIFQLSCRPPFCKRQKALKKMIVKTKQWFDAHCTGSDYEVLCSVGGQGWLCVHVNVGRGAEGGESKERLHAYGLHRLLLTQKSN